MSRLAIVAVIAAAAAACGPVREDLEVDWTFGGKDCAAAGVNTVQVDIQGELLDPNQFACVAGNQVNTGAYLGRFLTGHYTLTLQGFDSTGALAYKTTQDIVVGRASTQVPVDATSVRQTGSATFLWTFDGKTCAQAGNPIINASVDNQVLADENNNADLPCTQAGLDKIRVEPLSAGTHSFDFVAKVNGTPKYALNGVTVTVAANQDAQKSINLTPAAPTTASANLTWSFAGQSCAAANVDHVQIFFDPASNGSGGTDTGTVPCSTSGVDGASIEDVPEGFHTFAILGLRAGHIVYYTHQPPGTIFRAGLISDLFVPAQSP